MTSASRSTERTALVHRPVPIQQQPAASVRTGFLPVAPAVAEPIEAPQSSAVGSATRATEVLLAGSVPG
jgi:hypothetical protein